MGLAERKEALRLTNPGAHPHRLRSRWIVVSREIAPRILLPKAMRLKQLPMSLKEMRCEN